MRRNVLCYTQLCILKLKSNKGKKIGEKKEALEKGNKAHQKGKEKEVNE